MLLGQKEEINLKSEKTVNSEIWHFQTDWRATIKLAGGQGYFPFSFLAAVQVLPEKFYLFEEQEVFQQILLNLLSDQGFWLQEVRPSARDQLALHDRVIITDPQDTTLDPVKWTESKLISMAETKFWNSYRSFKESKEKEKKPVLIEEAESCICPDEPDFFHRCFLIVFNRGAGSNAKIKERVRSADTLISACKEQLTLHCDSLDLELTFCNDCNRPVTISLRKMLDNLAEICRDLLEKRERVLGEINQVDKISKDAYKRYKETVRKRKELEDELQSETLSTCLSEQLFEEVKVKVRVNLERYQRVKGEAPETIETKYFSSGIELGKIRPICDKLAEIFYRYKCNGKRPKKYAIIKKNLQKIVEVSLSDVLGEVIDIDTETDEASLNLAPVIVYIIIQKLEKSIKSDEFLSVPVQIFYQPLLPKSKEKEIIDDFFLFGDLCEIFAEYYGQSMGKFTRRVWSNAFFTYSDYGDTLLKNPALLFTIIKNVPQDRLYLPLYLESIVSCCRTNRPSLIHVSVLRNPNVTFNFAPECPEDPGWFAVCAFQKKLKDASENGHDWLKKFEELLRKPYTHNRMWEFLDECLSKLLSEEDIKMFLSEDQQDELASFFISKAPGVSKISRQTQYTAVLEYTLRLMLEAECMQRLYQWYRALFH